MVITGMLPLHHDIVVVPFANMALPGVEMAVARYNLQDGRSFLTKDSPRYAHGEQELHDAEILSVAVEIFPRSSRSPSENHFVVAGARAMFRSLRRKAPSDLGWLSLRVTQTLARALDLPASELLDGRLPCGYFRAFAKTPQPHVGIGVRDLLTINPTAESRVGELVIRTNDEGECAFGVLRRDGPLDPKAGPSWLGSTDSASDVRFGAEDWHQLATIVRVDRADDIALAAGRTEAERRAQSSLRVVVSSPGKTTYGFAGAS
jgi:hypothetical protein